MTHVGTLLNSRQTKLLDYLPDYNSQTVVTKSSVSMKDLAALTAWTGDEFAMFTKGKVRLIIRGNRYEVRVDLDKAKELNVQRYKWSGHTHT